MEIIYLARARTISTLSSLIIASPFSSFYTEREHIDDRPKEILAIIVSSDRGETSTPRLKEEPELRETSWDEVVLGIAVD